MTNPKSNMRNCFSDEADSVNNYLQPVVNGEEPVGMVWLKRDSRRAGFIYDIYSQKQQQGKGSGKQTMQLIEEGRKFGLEKIGLRGFSHSKNASVLFEKLGYKTTHVATSKDISDPL